MTKEKMTSTYSCPKTFFCLTFNNKLRQALCKLDHIEKIQIDRFVHELTKGCFD